jgi:protein TonB
MSSRSFLSVRRGGLALCQVLSLSLAAMAAQAQTAPAAPAAAADPKAQLSDVERAKRDADKVFQWIKFHAEKGEKKASDRPHDAKAEAVKTVAKPAPAAAAPAMIPARRQESDPAAERPLAARGDAGAAMQTVAATAPSPAPMAQTVAPAAPAPQPLSEAPSPQVVAIAAPSTSAPAGKGTPPEPETAEPDEPVPLKLVRRVDPEYPRGLLSMQRQGSVMVQFIVRPDGTVDAAQAVRSPDRKLSAAALNAVKQWRFEPIPAPRQVSVEIGFQVE